MMGSRISLPPAVERPRQTVLALILPATILFAVFWWLGLYVTRHGEPAMLWKFAQNLRGHETGLAWAFTNAGWASVLAPIYALCILCAIFVRRWQVRLLYLLAVALAAWGCADGFQRLFARPRRLDWLIRHEHAFSYPSSHAATATAFYLLAAILLLKSELPAWVRYVAFALLVAMWLGILWSRLALAAHYPTDILGGTCLGLLLALTGASLVRIAGGRLIER
jgi:membrane-associated phospholipid phosphatase